MDNREPLMPTIGVVTDIRIDTPDVKTFRVVTPDGKKAFEHKPGQCAMLSIPGVGEAMFSITSSPHQRGVHGVFHQEMRAASPNGSTAWRWGRKSPSGGPTAIPSPVDTESWARICSSSPAASALRPCAPVINYCRHYRDRYGKIDIVYGSRSMQDLVDYQEIINEWEKDAGVEVHLTIDREQPEWNGHVGFVPNYVKELGFDTNKVAILCGPPIMIKFTLAGLIELGFDKTQVYTTLELRMKCGIGKCGRCNVGAKYVCKDGPVFRCDQLDELPNEY